MSNGSRVRRGNGGRPIRLAPATFQRLHVQVRKADYQTRGKCGSAFKVTECHLVKGIFWIGTSLAFHPLPDPAGELCVNIAVLQEP